MKHLEEDVVKQESINERNIALLRENFPGVIEENIDGSFTVNARKLQLLIDPKKATIEEDGFELSWVGKKEAYHTAFAKNTKILKPLKDDSKDFDTTENILIKGDNLDALRILKDNYFEAIKMIYIDPPYNTKSENFVYRDNFTKSLEETMEELGYDAENIDYIKNIQGARTHSGWLSFMYPRLLLARDLLKDEGVIFISIDDNEQANLKVLCDEVFGEQNFISTISRVMKSGGAKGNFFTPNIEFILVYAKDISRTKFFRSKITEAQIQTYYNKVESDGPRKGEKYGEERLYKASLDARPNQRYWIECPDGSFVIPPGNTFPKKLKDGEQIKPDQDDGVWKWTYATYLDEYKKGHIIFKETTTSALINQDGEQSKYNIYNKLWLLEQQAKGKVPSNFIADIENRQSSSELKAIKIPFNYAKPVKLIKHLLEMVRLEENDYILDFFAGSGTTAHAIFELNAPENKNTKLKFILVQLPESINATKDKEAFDFVKSITKNTPTIFEITAERLRRAGEKVKNDNKDKEGIENLDIGFRVFEVVEDERQTIYKKSLGEATQDDLDLFTTPRMEDIDTILYNLLVAEKLPLSTKIECLEVNTLYIAHNVAFIVGDIDLEKVSNLLSGRKNVEYITIYSPLVNKDKFTLEVGNQLSRMGLSNDKMRFRG